MHDCDILQVNEPIMCVIYNAYNEYNIMRSISDLYDCDPYNQISDIYVIHDVIKCNYYARLLYMHK